MVGVSSDEAPQGSEGLASRAWRWVSHASVVAWIWSSRETGINWALASVGALTTAAGLWWVLGIEFAKVLLICLQMTFLLAALLKVIRLVVGTADFTVEAVASVAATSDPSSSWVDRVVQIVIRREEARRKRHVDRAKAVNRLLGSWTDGG